MLDVVKLEKILELLAMNWRPLSVSVSSGRPWVVNTKRKACTVTSAVVLNIHV